jgi:hypothetical protein
MKKRQTLALIAAAAVVIAMVALVLGRLKKSCLGLIAFRTDAQKTFC